MMSGPCEICGAVNYSASFGGPTICPSCDCGNFGPAAMKTQTLTIAALRKEIDQLRAAQPESLTGCLHPGEFGCQHYGKCLSVSCDHYGKTEYRPRMTLEAQDPNVLYPKETT